MLFAVVCDVWFACMLFDVALRVFVVSRSAVGLVVKYLVAIEMPGSIPGRRILFRFFA